MVLDRDKLKKLLKEKGVMTAEVFPESLNAMRLLAHSYYMAGDEERSLKVQAKMIASRMWSTAGISARLISQEG